MEITDQVREAVMREVMAELKQYGHSFAALHVESCRKRLSIRMAKNAVQDQPSVKAASNAA
jgi:hypothetical protein